MIRAKKVRPNYHTGHPTSRPVRSIAIIAQLMGQVKVHHARTTPGHAVQHTIQTSNQNNVFITISYNHIASFIFGFFFFIKLYLPPKRIFDYKSYPLKTKGLIIKNKTKDQIGYTRWIWSSTPFCHIICVILFVTFEFRFSSL